jgi:osmoprotectant transport system ATP-binding protein
MVFGGAGRIAGEPGVTPSGGSGGPAIELRGVSYRVDAGRSLIHNLDLTVERGEMLIVLGRSGSGKTTTLRLMNGLLQPAGGEIFVEGRPQADWDPIRLRRTIGYVMQDVGLFPHWTVERNIALVPSLEGWPAPRIRDRVREMLRLVGLDAAEFAARFPRQLSGGQRQRVGVARALAADPPILLMDEPFGALDPVTGAELEREFRALAGRLGKTIVFVTHNLRAALLLGTRIALLAQGRLIGVYRPDQFLRAADPEVRAFVASLDSNPRDTNPQDKGEPS